jgi:hypothetical protein
MDTSVSPIIERVKKLLALSTSANANEAANAAAAANRLIDAYRLSSADLETNEDEIDPMEEDQDFVYESGRITAWKVSLVNVLASHYGLAIINKPDYSTGRMTSRYRLVGRRNDIAVAKYMFSYLMNECLRLSVSEARGRGRIFAASYYQGFVSGIREQLNASRVEAKKNATEAAIIKIDSRSKEANDFLNGQYKSLKYSKHTSQSQIDCYAYGKGQVAGKNTHLGQSMNCKSVKMLNA